MIHRFAVGEEVLFWTDMCWKKATVKEIGGTFTPWYDLTDSSGNQYFALESNVAALNDPSSVYAAKFEDLEDYLRWGRRDLEKRRGVFVEVPDEE